MTAKRPYRKTPLTPSRRSTSCASSPASSSIPNVVDAFVKTKWVETSEIRAASELDAGGPIRLRPLPPLIGEHGSAATASGAAPADTR